MILQSIRLSENEDFGVASGKILVTPNKKYFVSSEIVGISGKPYCAFFGVTLFNKNNQIIGRRIRWLNDFTNQKKNYSILFNAPEDCTEVRIIYRINKETPQKSACEYKILPLQEIEVRDSDSSLQESFDYHLSFISPSITLSSEQENVLERNLVWIFALPRSGTTWLGTQLLSHNMLSMNEPLIAEHLGKLHGDYNQVVRTAVLRSVKPDYFFNPKYGNTLKLHIRRLILNRIYAQFQDLEHKIVINEPEGSTAADIISQCLPNSKIIFLIRDGRDVVDSNVDSLRTNVRTNKEQHSDDLLARITRTSKEWVAITELLLKTYEKRPKEFGKVIKYKDLLTNTREMLKELYHFIGIPITDNKLKEIIDSNDSKMPELESRTGKWKDNFNEKEIAAMHSVMGNMLQKLGYTENKEVPNVVDLTPQEILDLESNQASLKAFDMYFDRQDTLEKNLVWIFALPRSGTTWLGTQLLSHNTHSMDEPLIGFHLGEWTYSSEGLARQIDEYSSKSNYFFNEKYKYSWMFYLRRLILNRVAAQFQDFNKKIIIKEPNGSAAVDVISQCLPNSKIIFLIRDGRDVVDSKIDSIRDGGWQAKGPGMKVSASLSQEQKISIITSHAKAWVATTELLLKTHEKRPKELSMMIRYEDLRARTYDTVKQVYQFIDTGINEDQLRKIVEEYTYENLPEARKGPGKFVRAASPGLWKQNFNEKEIAAMHSVMGNMLQKLGYKISS